MKCLKPTIRFLDGVTLRYEYCEVVVNSKLWTTFVLTVVLFVGDHQVPPEVSGSGR